MPTGKKNKLKRKTIIIAVVFPIILLVFAIYFFKKPSHDFLLSPAYEYFPNSDKEGALGKSEIKTERLGDAIHCNYTLKKGDPYPYVSLQFRRDKSELFDTKEYTLHLHIDTDQDIALSARIGLMVDGYTKKEIPGTYVFYEKNINLVKGKNIISMPLDEIVRIPSWWFINKPFTESELPAVSRGKTEYIALYDTRGNNINKEKSFLISKLEIHPSYSRHYLFGAYALIVYIIIIFVLYKFRKRKFLRILVPVDLSEHESKEKNYPELILDYISQNFANPNLKISDIAKEVGLTENQISQKLKLHTGKTFKPYLNFIRIERGKKLLLESDMHVNEIAYQIGYNSAHHFIRVFKALKDDSPQSFRTRIKRT
ncbi:MAG: AraC-like DNA-binding protein [Saprospiraceae bacterium]|jgi:AraC-like DNA-binding protein